MFRVLARFITAILVIGFLSSVAVSQQRSDGQAKYERYAEGLIKQYDSDNDGKLSVEETKNMRRQPTGADVNKDGFITEAELIGSLSGANRRSSTPQVKAKEHDTSVRRQVRVIYLVSRDREENVEYTAAVEHAIQDLQNWYGRQLKGPTFRLSEPVVEVVKSNRPADWFYGNPNGKHKDNWGYNNALDEAKRLLGARHNDPKYVWVIYSDGPGNKGRGGNGVTCLPEDDLLGLVGKHPTQKNKLRWIAGLGHELGHAFGLPHPKDTRKHANAIMWTGIYGKYPDKAYLTDEDKRTLMRSPFFYQKNDTPVIQKRKVFARYTYRGGAFEQNSGEHPIDWTETKNKSDIKFTFEETRRDTEYIFLNDSGRGLTIRLPVNGGLSSISTDGEKTWRALYQVSGPSITDR